MYRSLSVLSLLLPVLYALALPAVQAAPNLRATTPNYASLDGQAAARGCGLACRTAIALLPGEAVDPALAEADGWPGFATERRLAMASADGFALIGPVATNTAPRAWPPIRSDVLEIRSGSAVASVRRVLSAPVPRGTDGRPESVSGVVSSTGSVHLAALFFAGPADVDLTRRARTVATPLPHALATFLSALVLLVLLGHRRAASRPSEIRA